MPSNYLEQLTAEWYEHQDYFVRRNIRVGLRREGGHEGELDIVAFKPGHLVHIETSMDTISWEAREERFRKKFETGERYIRSLFQGFTLPDQIEKIAVLGLASRANHEFVGGGRIVLLNDLLNDILNHLKGVSWLSHSIPEAYPILRTLQVVAWYKKEVIDILAGGNGA
jgi:hypothetical protein